MYMKDWLTMGLAFAVIRDVNDLNGCMSRNILILNMTS